MGRLCLLLLCVLAVLPQAADAGPVSMSAVVGSAHADLSYVQDPVGGFEFTLSFTRDGQPLHVVKELSFFVEPALKPMHGFPGKPYEAVAMYAYSGGAHCCTTAYVFTANGMKWWLSSIEYIEGELTDMLVPGEPLAMLNVMDGSLGRFAPSFSAASYLQRFLVWDEAQGWRVDRVGENTARYLANCAEVVRAEQEQGDALRREYLEKYDPAEQIPSYYPYELQEMALQAAYYGHMAGQDEAHLAAEYQRMFPQAVKKYEFYIPFAEILKAADTYNPVHFIQGR